ncbi:MAG: Lpg1974 family pore-forming outer membrane protein [Alphaproteobacteria bacterium]|nr:Lpg1974 family pore-forming outer membrane protein [Alphaproteobacteria bacterium]
MGISNKESSSEYASFFSTLFNIIDPYYYTNYDSARATHREEHYIVDFEARRDVGLGSGSGAKTSVKAGARFAYFNAATNTHFYSFFAPSYYVNENRTSKFVGAGPRIGFDTMLPVSTNVSLDVSGAASVLFGVKNTSVRAFNFFGASAATASKFHVVPTFEASAALTFSPESSRAKFSVGVRAEAWLGVFNQSTAVTTNSNANRYQVTPFLRMTTPIGGAGGPATSTSAFGNGGASGGFDGIFELGARAGYLWRGGNDLNSSGLPNTEIDDFPLAGLGSKVALPLGSDWLVQLEADGETAFDNDTVGGVPANDTYAGGYTAGGQVAYQFNQLQFGGFAGAGQTFFHDDDPVDQDADHWLAGLGGRFLSPFGSIAVQAGYLDSSADNSETLSDALFGRVIGQTFFHEGRTMLQAGFGYASGTQDADDPPVNPTDVFSWDVTLEHQLERKIGDANLSVFLSYEGIRVSEQSTSGLSETIQDNTVMAGLKFRLGAADTLYEREMRTVPGLPNVARWLGSVPAVD